MYKSLPPPSGRQAPYRPSTGWQGAAGSPHCIKGFSPPPPFASHDIGEGERRDEGGSCNGEALPDIGFEPQVINISQLSLSKFFVFLIL